MSGLILFIAATATVLATPGPTNALLATSAALVGFRKSTPLMLAEISGYFITIGCLLAVSRPLFAAYPALAQLLRAALVVYLIFLALSLWRAPQVELGKGDGIITFRRVFLTTLLNPKGLIFAFGIFPPLQGAQDAGVHFATFAATTFVVAAGWLTFGASMGRLANRTGRQFRFSRVTSVVLVFFACFVAASIFKVN